MKGKWIAWILCGLMLFGMLPSSALAETSQPTQAAVSEEAESAPKEPALSAPSEETQDPAEPEAQAEEAQDFKETEDQTEETEDSVAAEEPAEEPEQPAAGEPDEPLPEESSERTGAEEPVSAGESAAPEDPEQPAAGGEIELETIEAGTGRTGMELFGSYVSLMLETGKTGDLTFPRMRSLPDPVHLSEPEQTVERLLKQEMIKIAEGTRTSTVVDIYLSDYGFLLDDIDRTKVVKTLIRDCAYEMYWFGRKVSVSYKATFEYLRLRMSFRVDDDFIGDAAYTVDPSKVLTAKAAVPNAQTIVDQNAALGDYEKLRKYRDVICALTDYNYDAAANSSAYGENPWQLIYVFDNDPATKVVCEGYAKAFEYLCNKSTFRSSLVNCFCVSGTVRFYLGGGGGHMWNIVTMDDGRNYMTDITNCDYGTGGSDVRFLLPAESGSVEDGYSFETGDFYPYDTDTRLSCADGPLTLSTTQYLVSIRMNPEPTKKTYLRGQTFDPAGGGLLLTYKNGTTETIALTDEGVSLAGYDKLCLGEQTITVSYDHCTTGFQITVSGEQPVSAEVTSLPDQTVYLEAKDPFDPTGGVITLTYAGGETGTVDLGDASVTGFDNTAVGVQTLSAAFAGQTAQFSITIKAKTLIAVSILTLPENLVYFEGDPFDPAGGVLQLEYDNDTTSTVGFADAAVTGYDCDLIGEQTLTVSFGGKSDTFPVTVLRKNIIVFEEGALPSSDTVDVDGVSYAVANEQVLLPYGLDASIMTEYTFNTASEDPHTIYPTGMKVWRIEPYGEIKIARPLPDFENILQYSGSSIRFSGKKGIRMITSVPKDKRSALTGNGLAGYTLVEYGTVVAWDSELAGASPVLNGPGAKQAYAYKKGVADPIYKKTGNLIQYTNVLVNLTDEKCVPDLAMRPYMIVQDGSGVRCVIYGGTIRRNIGYIAWQNRNAFKPGTDAYKYIWGIIRYVYGDLYDADYRG